MLKSAARSDSDGKQRGRDADDGERDDRYCASAGAAGRTTTTTSRLRRAALRRWRRLRFDRFSLAAARRPSRSRAHAGGDHAHAQEGAALDGRGLTQFMPELATVRSELLVFQLLFSVYGQFNSVSVSMDNCSV